MPTFQRGSGGSGLLKDDSNDQHEDHALEEAASGQVLRTASSNSRGLKSKGSKSRPATATAGTGSRTGTTRRSSPIRRAASTDGTSDARTSPFQRVDNSLSPRGIRRAVTSGGGVRTSPFVRKGVVSLPQGFPTNKSNLLDDDNDESDLSNSDNDDDYDAPKKKKASTTHAAAVIDFGGGNVNDNTQKDPVFAFNDPMAPPKMLQQDFSLGVATVDMSEEESKPKQSRRPSLKVPPPVQKTKTRNILNFSYIFDRSYMGDLSNMSSSDRRNNITGSRNASTTAGWAGFGKHLNVPDQRVNIMDQSDGSKNQQGGRRGASHGKSRRQTIMTKMGFGDSLLSTGESDFANKPLNKDHQHHERRGPSCREKALECIFLVGLPFLFILVAVPATMFFVWPKLQDKVPHAHASPPTNAPSAGPDSAAAPSPTISSLEPDGADGVLTTTASESNKPSNTTDTLLDLVGDGGLSAGVDTISKAFSKSKAFDKQVKKGQNKNNATNSTPREEPFSMGPSFHFTTNNEEFPFAANEDHERWLDLQGLIVRENLSSTQEFNNPDSIAYKALEWIVAYDETLEMISSDTAWSLLERYALAVLYFSTHPRANPSDSKRTTLVTPHSIAGTVDWMHQTKTSVCDWQGIHCGHLQRVVAVNLARSGLAGNLPSELVGLSHLHNLDLSVNHIHGTLPPEWSRLSFLKLLSLADNQLEGEFPESWKDLVNQLDVLDLSENDISGGPDAISPWPETDEENHQI